MNFADKNYKKAIIQKLLGGPELLALYSAGTNMPLVECSQETFNDQAFVFENEELLKEFVKPYFERKMPLRGIKFLAKDRMKFFATLLTVNVDEIVYIDQAGRHMITLSDFVKKQDFSKLPPHQRPVENPQLQLSGLYFVQEASRAVPPEEKTDLKELEEELAANIVKGVYIMPAELILDPAEQENAAAESIADGQETHLETDSLPDGKTADGQTTSASGSEAAPQQIPRSGKFKIPMVKTPQDEKFVPIFTDNIEFAKYNRNNQLKALVVPFANLRRMMVKESKGYMINPNGFHIHLTAQLLNGLMQRFDVKEPAQPAAPESASQID